MTKIDKSYLERLGEVLYDEKKVINYKTVSIMMGVHVNIAKPMLYHLHKTGNENGKKIYATYYVSGMMPRRVMSSIGKQAGDTSEESLSQQSDMDAYLVAICKEQDLEDLKAKYSKIFSVHMYALSPFPIESCDVLANLVQFPLRDNEGRTPVDFGPITCSAAQKLKEGSDIIRYNDASKPKITEEVKKPAKTNGVVKDNKSVSQDISKDETNRDDSQEPKTKLAKPSVPEKNGGRLKTMFATQASKPKSRPKKVDKPEVESEVKGKTNEKSETKASKNPAKEKDTRKRKRIRDLLSSDSEDEKMAVDEDESSPEAPAPRKRIQIESDSDDDFKETPKKTTEPSTQNDEKVSTTTTGRKRVSKTVSKTYVDKDGFLVVEILKQFL